MRKMWNVVYPMLVVLILMGAFLWVTDSAAAQDQCEVTGNSYTMVAPDGWEYTLSFVETGPQFSPAPRCGGTVTLNGFDTFPWSVTSAGLIVAGFRSVLSESGLTIYCIPSDMHRLQIGDTVYMTEGEIPSLLFIK